MIVSIPLSDIAILSSVFVLIVTVFVYSGFTGIGGSLGILNTLVKSKGLGVSAFTV